jgi:hypothetical protein
MKERIYKNSFKIILTLFQRGEFEKTNSGGFKAGASPDLSRVSFLIYCLSLFPPVKPKPL